jgi:hypothetical protein
MYKDEESKLVEKYLSLNPSNPEKIKVIDTGTPVPWYAFVLPKVPSLTLTLTHIILQMEITYLNLGTLATDRENKMKLEKMITNQTNEFDESSAKNWLDSLRAILHGCVRVVDLLEKGESVIVQSSVESEGAFPLLSLTQMIVDPYFRTLKGFRTLIEKDWVCFGFPFASRVGVSGLKKPTTDQV